MPRRRFKKKRMRRKRKRQSAYGQIVTRRNPFPVKFVAKHTYVESVSLNPGAGFVLGTVLMSGNGMYDPFVAAGGHQPMGFDNLASIYAKYTVVGAKIKCSFGVTASSSNYSYVCGIALRDNDESATANYLTYIENGATYTNWSPESSGAPILRLGYSPKRFHGLNNIMDNGSYGGDSSNNPSKGANFHVFVGSSDVTSDLNAVNCVIELQYTAVWHDPISLLAS